MHSQGDVTFDPLMRTRNADSAYWYRCHSGVVCGCVGYTVCCIKTAESFMSCFGGQTRWPKETCLKWGVHISSTWQTTERYVLGKVAGYCQYVGHLLLSLYWVVQKTGPLDITCQKYASIYLPVMLTKCWPIFKIFSAWNMHKHTHTRLTAFFPGQSG